MARRSIKMIFLLFLMVVLLFSCSDKVVETDESPQTPDNSSETSPAPSTGPSLPDSPVPSKTTAPSPSPVETPEKPKVVHAYLKSSIEETRLEIFNHETITYSGNVVLTLWLDTRAKDWIEEYMYINEDLINPDQVAVGLTSVTIFLDETQPENFVFVFKDTGRDDEHGAEEEFKVNFIHKPYLTCDISVADPMISNLHAPPIYLATPVQRFSLVFNKPVDGNTLQFKEFMKDYEMESSWVSDREMKLTVRNLSVNEPYLNISVKYIMGMEAYYGNKINDSGRYAKPLKTDSPVYHYMISDRQHLYSIVPESNEIETIGDFDYGMIFEDASDDLEYLSLGIITGEQEGWSYAKAIYDVESGSLTPLDTKISSSVSKALEAEITAYATGLYNPMLINEFWNNDNNYHYFYGNSIFNIDPVDLSAKRYFSDYETSRTPHPVFHLANGNMAVIRQDADGNINRLAIIGDNDYLANEYNLPFITKTGEGWIQYKVHIADAGGNRLFVSGYEMKPGEENILSTYLLELEDGSLNLFAKGSSLIDCFPEAGYVLYNNYDTVEEKHKIDCYSLAGDLIHTLVPGDGVYFQEFTYNKYKNVFYIKQYSEQTGDYSILVMDASTFEPKQSPVTFGHDIWMIGVGEDGKLLVMDKL